MQQLDLIKPYSWCCALVPMVGAIALLSADDELLLQIVIQI